MIEFIQPSLTAISTVLSIVKEGKSLAPESPEAKELTSQLKPLEENLKKLEAEVAERLGYELCKCTFPPQIMLFVKESNSDVCPSCDHSIDRKGDGFFEPFTV